jgi:uncharacterized repeat protein (TIGR01451 family)
MGIAEFGGKVCSIPEARISYGASASRLNTNGVDRMNASRRVCLLFVSIVVVLLGARRVTAQCVSLTTLGSAYTQNFDTLSNTAGSTTNNLTITGWFLTESGGGARDNEQYAVDTGASTTGDMYSYGAAAATERALGQLRSGTLIPLFGSCYTNNTGSTIASLDVNYFGEEWRLGTAARTDQMNFEYSTNATDLVTGTWTNVAALNFVTPDTVTAGAKNGNAAADRTNKVASVASLSIPNGATFWIRWNDTDATGADDGLAVDDFSLTPQGAVTLPNLTVTDVTQAETNVGTTTFTFQVNLSAPAGPGGVTFDIATADGTAQDDNPAAEDNDYVAQALTPPTASIAAGNNSFAFNVTVNGDVVPEANETFFVNVTNVTGATVTDGQGQGTITNDDVACASLSINDVTQAETNAGTTTFAFTVSLSQAGCGTVTFDIATADGTAQDDNPVAEDNDYVPQSLTGQTITFPATYTFNVTVNGDATPESDETFFVNITNVSPANVQVSDGQGLGTIVNDDFSRIHDVQGNGAATPVPGSTVTVEGVVTSDFQGTNIQGFFLQEEDADADADPATSEGIFIFCGACPTPVAEGQRVRATGTVSEFNLLTEITASTAPSVVVTNAGNNLAQVTPATIDLPIAGVVNDYYEAREGMKVTFVDTLTVSEYFELGRYGQIILYEGGRPRQFTEANAPSVAGNAAWADTLSRRQVILDDDNNAQEWYLTTSTPPGPADGLQYVFYPRANGGLSVGTQGTDFFRGGDLVNGLTGVLHWSFAGQAGTDAWRIRPTAANPATFTVANPRPATPPAVGGSIHVVGMNLLNYFTTIDTTASTSTGPCAPSGTLDCRGADSAAELTRQRARAALVICTLNADVYGFAELENTTPSASITDLLGAVNASCGGAHPYAFANTGGTLGTDAIRVQQIYRTGIVSPVGSPLSDLDPIHSRPPTAQTYDVVDAANPAFGQRFTAVINHFKSKGSSAGLPGDADIGDGAGASNATRTAQASRLLTWINSTVLPAAGDPDVLLLGDFNAYAKEDPINTLIGGGYTDLETLFHGANAYSYLFDGQLGHLDYGFASASMLPQVTGADAWHINADEVDLFDYNDEIRDSPGESTFEEKPDGSALVPPRVVFQAGTPYRASDHDPVLLGLFAVADLVVTKTDSPDPVNAGANLTYTITVTNNGPDAAATASWSDTLPAGTTFVSMPAVAGWSCTTPAVGAGGIVTCNNPSFAVGSSVFTLTVAVAPSVANGTVLSNTATVTSATGDGNPGNESDTETTTVSTSADLQISKTDTPDPVNAGSNISYQITITNNGPSNAAAASFSDTLPAGTTFVSLSTTGPWSCTTPAVGANGTVSCTNASFLTTVDFFTIVVNVDPSVAAGTVLSNTATMASTTSDPSPGNESATATTTVTASADLQISKTDTPDPVDAGSNITYQITITNNGPSNAAAASFSDTLPAGTTFVSLSTTGPWSCTTPAVGSGGTVSCTNPSFGVTVDFFTIVVNVDPSVAAGTVLSNTATMASTTSDPSPGNESDTATTTVATSADLQVTKTDSPDPVTAGTNLTYTITVTNAGPSNASTVALADTTPAGTTFVSLSSPGGWSCTTPAVGGTGAINCSIATLGVTNAVFTLVVNVNPNASGAVTNTATVSETTTDPVPGNDSATANTTVGAGSADVSVTKTDSPDPISAGSVLTYTITVANSGPSDAANVSLADTVPAGTTFINLQSPGGWSCSTPGVGGTGAINCSIASFLSGGNAVFTLLVQVNTPLPTGTIITNTATVTSTTPDPSGGNNSATTTTTVQPITNFTATKTVAGTFVSGTTVTYTVILTNNMGFTQGNNFGNEFADILPAGLALTGASASTGTIATILLSNIVTWNGTIPNGTSVTITITATITAPSGTISNQGNAIIDTDNSGTNESAVFTDDPSTAAPSDPTSFTIVPATADLSVTKTDSPDPVTAGTNLTYTITVNNAGPNSASTVSLSDTLPANTSFVSLPAVAGWSCTTPAVGAGGAVTCTNPSMAIGSSVFTLTVSVSATAGGGTVISNTATVTSATADPNTGNESDTETTSVISPATVTGTKSASGSFQQGSNVTYTVVLSNAGPAAQGNNPGDEFVDVLPSQLTLISATSTSGTTLASVGTNTVTWNGSIPAGGSVTITIHALVEADAPVGSTITNAGTINGDTNGDGVNEPGSATTANGAGNPFIVGAPAAATSDIPALDPRSLIVLATLLAAIGVLIARRS